ncbi:MAG: lysophospholipid acyltransferase family protein [Candidatus Omnitrophica bacterium]|nr:lysophospholipid acyltransferase family protein [Candidatus Omnitrophota bacterium]
MRILGGLILLLPLAWVRFLGAGVGFLAWLFLPKVRRQALRNLGNSLGRDYSRGKRRKICRSMFMHLGIVIAELLWFPRLKPGHLDSLAWVEGLEHLHRVLREGKGCVFVTPHMGNWELTGAYCAMKGYPLHVIAREIYYEPYNRWLVSLRSSKGVKTLYRHTRQTFRASLKALARNELIAILPDQDVDSVDGVFVQFFGAPAWTPTGPVSMALASGAPILPAVTVREKGHYKIVLEEPIYVESSGDHRRDFERYTAQYTRIFEKHIRRHPDQWVWLHKRWKTRQPEVAREAEVQSA